MANVPLPDPQQIVGRCSRCNAEIRIDPTWYRFFIAIRDALRSV